QVPAPRDSAQDSAFALPPVTVTVTRGSASLDLVPMAVSVVDRRDRGRARADLTMEDALSGIPGVFVANRYNFSLDQRLSIRGFGSRSNFGLRGVKVVVDGVPQTLPDGQGQLSNVEFGAVDRIEVLRGSASSLYGNASGGVIAFETERPSLQPFAQAFRIESGAFGLVRLLSHTSARRGSMAGTLTASWFSLDGFREHSAARAFQVQGTGEMLLSPANLLQVRLAHTSAPEADNPGALTEAELAMDPSQAAPNNLLRHAGKDVDQQQASVTWRHFGNGVSGFSLTAFGVARRLDNPLATNVFVTLDRRAGGARLEATSGIGTRATLTWGTDIQRMRDDRTNAVANAGHPTDTLTLDQRETVTELGPFAHLAWRVAPAVAISLGARYDRVSFDVADHFLADSVDNSGGRTMAAWSGHAGVSLVRSTAFIPYLNVSTSFETPTTTELANRPNGAGGFNDQLDPQRAVTLELGFRGRLPGVEFSGAGFLGRISDALIQFQEVGGRAFFANAGKLHNDGVELGLALRPLRTVELGAAYTWAHYRFAEYRIVAGTTVDTLDGNTLAGVPEHFLRLRLRLTPLPSLRIDLEQQFSSSVFADDANSITAPGWGDGGVTTIRASGSVVIGVLALEPFGGINNLFDKAYVSSVTPNGFGGRVFEPAPRRNGYFGLEIRYR
ncbi:MAG: TonB-dependent receptor, partial [Gemmatimonadota bacterium]